MYAIISLQGKQYRVEEGQRLLVDHLAHAAGKSFHPTVLFVGGDGTAEFSPKAAEVTARVVQDVLGDKIRIGKYKAKTGYRRHTGHRSKLTEIEITGVALKAAKPSRQPAATDEEEKPAPTPRTAAKPRTSAGKAPARAKEEDT
jgi:large subunit ribosomal protein L21